MMLVAAGKSFPRTRDIVRHIGGRLPRKTGSLAISYSGTLSQQPGILIRGTRRSFK